jgi:hypothetical protein
MKPIKSPSPANSQYVAIQWLTALLLAQQGLGLLVLRTSTTTGLKQGGDLHKDQHPVDDSHPTSTFNVAYRPLFRHLVGRPQTATVIVTEM